ncbi:MAG: glucose-6-phosphate isomerase [Planctomycetes bacterium]|nr:glucose-6-phosphate isomerase [Planctomycetota bacterium]
MELPDEAVGYQYQSLLLPVGEEWTPAAEIRTRHYLNPGRLKDLTQRLMQAKSQVAAEREARPAPAEALPIHGGFIDLPQNFLDGFRRKGEASELGRIEATAARLREQADRVILLGAGGEGLGGRVLFRALKSGYHNELPPETRFGVPQIYFEGDNVDNDALQELLDLIQGTCVDPERREERWAVVALSKSGTALETMTALRVLRRDAVEYYGMRSEWLKQLFVAVTGPSSPLRQLFKADGHADDDILTIPDNVGSRFTVFTAAGLLPAALMGLDVRALLQGAASMTKRFLEEPFERNPVLQFASVNYLMSEDLRIPIRVLSIWSKKLDVLGQWYTHLVAESLGKQGRGPLPLAMVQTPDLYTRGQHQHEGPRNRFTINLVVKNARMVPITIGMADRNEDGLNTFARKGLPDLMAAALSGTNQACWDVARPTCDLVVPMLSEHTMGQLLQMLMLSTVVEGRLMAVNPYSAPGAEVARRNMMNSLKG